jgi:hypothetical protein
MTAIWYAISIYMIGVAVVLYLRPKTMFRDDGMWKEFGLQKDGTVFPFWMFAIVWAVLAYALATLLSMMFASIVLNSTDSAVSTVQAVQPVQSTAPIMQPISQAPMMNMPSEVPKVPGYYILDPYSSGAPRYIYYGASPPGV